MTGKHSISKLDKKIYRLDFKDGKAVKYLQPIWAGVEISNRRTVFSRFGEASGIGATVSAHKSSEISEKNLVEIDGKTFVVVSSILDKRGLFLEITAARADIRSFQMLSHTETVDKYNEVKWKKTEGEEFDGILAERYIRGEEFHLYNQEEMGYILMIPKERSLEIGSVIRRQDGLIFEVRAKHLDGDFWNEYELYRREDV